MLLILYHSRPPMTYAGAGFVLLTTDRQSVLLVHDSRSKKWGFPKGHREQCDTSDVDTAVRECWEETGLKRDDYVIFPESFKINKGSQSYIFRYAVLKQDEFRTRIIHGHSYEIAELQWVSIRSLLEADNVLDGNKYLRTWIEDIQAGVSKKSVQLYKLLLERLPLQEPVSAPNSVTCA